MSEQKFPDSTPSQLSLRTPLPPAIANAVRDSGGKPDRLLLHTASDIDLIGQYSPQWVLADAEQLWVVSAAAPEKPLRQIAMAEIKEFRTISVVGSGLLQAKSGQVWLDLARFSNRRKHLFNRLARRLDDVRKDGVVEFTDEDTHDPRQCQTCGLLLQYAGETCPRCVKRGAAISRLIQLMRPHWPAATTMMVLLLVGIALDMVSPLLTRYLVDNVLQVGASPEIEATPAADHLHLLMIVVAALAGVQLTRAFVTTINGRISSRVGTAITFDIRGRLVAHLQKLGLSYYDKQQVGSLVGRVAYDTEALQLFMSQLTSGFLMQILMVVFSLLLMFTLAPTLAIWTLLPAPFVIAGMVFFYRYIYPRYHRFYDRSSKQAGQLSGMLSGIRVVKAFAQEDQELNRFMATSANLRDARRSVDASSATFYPLMGILFQVGGWLVWYIGGGRVLDQTLSLGTLMAFFGYLAMFYGPLASLTALTTWLTQFTTQLHRIFEVLDTPIAIQEAKDATPMERIDGDLQFKDVVFSYTRQTPVIKSMNFHVKAGESIGVVGRSGCGKSTLINLIARFYDIDEGRVLIDGTDVRKLRITDLRRQMSIVLQEPFLFRGTIWSNLAYAHQDASPQQVIAAARAANAHDFVMKQYHGYDTWVGERGAGLSGGERQRLSIARALMGDPRILIFDEATSALDSESEQAIQAAMAEMVRGRTTIIIAHRLSTLRICDRIIVVDEGKVVEEGTHDQLMEMGGHYAKLFNLQVGPGGAVESVDDAYKVEEERKKAAEAKAKALATIAGETGDTDGNGDLAPAHAHDDDDADKKSAPALPPITGYQPRWLTPENSVIHLGSLHALHVTVKNERIYPGVFALRCLPVRHPTRYLSLRYTDAAGREQEVGLIENLDHWPPEAQQHVRQSLLRRYFVHTVLRIFDVQPFQNFVTLKVDTDLGPMEFIMRLSSEAAHDYGEGGKMLLDLEENRYLIPNVDALPVADRKLFQRHIYW